MINYHSTIQPTALGQTSRLWRLILTARYFQFHLQRCMDSAQSTGSRARAVLNQSINQSINLRLLAA